MVDSLVLWPVFAVLYIFTYIAFLQLFKVATKNTTNIGALAVVVNIIAAVSILVLSPFFDWKWEADWLTWFLLALAFTLYAVNDFLDAVSRKNLEITTDVTIHQTYRIWFFILLIFLLSNPFSWIKFLGGIIIVAVNMFLFYDKDKFKFNKFVVLKFISAAIFAVALSLEVRSAAHFNVPFLMFMSFGVSAIYMAAGILITKRATPKSFIKEIARRQWWIILLCGLLVGLSGFAFVYGQTLARENGKGIEFTSVTAAYVVLNVFFAYFFLKERSDLFKKIIAACIIICSIAIIALG